MQYMGISCLTKLNEISQHTRGHNEYTPIDIWGLFFTNEILQDFIDNTHSFAKITHIVRSVVRCR